MTRITFTKVYFISKKKKRTIVLFTLTSLLKKLPLQRIRMQACTFVRFEKYNKNSIEL